MYRLWLKGRAGNKGFLPLLHPPGEFSHRTAYRYTEEGRGYEENFSYMMINPPIQMKR